MSRGDWPRGSKPFRSMNATQKLTVIEFALTVGVTVWFQTYGRNIPVSPRTAAKWTAAGRPVVKASGNSLWIGRGKSYDCADLCQITFQGPDAGIAKVSAKIAELREGR